jgi:hypothetical protein
MVVGCGDSRLSEKIYELMGFECLTNIDFSQTIINTMTKRTERFEDMEYLL